MSAIIRRMIPAANLTLLYGHLPLEARFEAARRDGFRAVEILFPYDRSPEWYAGQLQRHDLRLVLVNTPIEASVAPWGRAALPGQQQAFRDDFARVAAVCEATGCAAVHVMTGCVAADDPAARQTLLENLSWAAGTWPGLRLQLEALNASDVPGYFYSRPQQVIRILQAIGADAAGLQFDFYHVVREGLDLLAELGTGLPWVRHVQVAGSPARNEPDLGRDQLLEAFRRLHRAGYRGHIGYEYRPAGDVASGLAWADPLLELFSPQP